MVSKRCVAPQVWLRPFSAALGYEQMNLFKLSFAQLFGITHASVVLPSFARILQSPRGNFAGFVIPYLSRITRVDETAGRINLHKLMWFATYVI